jgi:hypothetical protein
LAPSRRSRADRRGDIDHRTARALLPTVLTGQGAEGR